MNMMQRMVSGALVLGVLLSVGGCAGMSRQERGTAVGAGVGAVGGAVITGGSPLGTIGGAAIGGVIGHEVNKPE